MTDAVDHLFLDFQAALAGRYSLERELGRGGMGVVYLAREVRLDRLVAIKLLPPELAAVPGLRDRFLREARMAARLSHPNIVPIFAVDEIDQFVFYAMAFVDGETLAHRVQTRGPMPPGEATRLLREVAWALAYAHVQGVIHRDVKPENILLEASGRALVTDFGIARVTRETGATGPGEVIGTPEFMSPEQAVGDTVDGRADLYSLGAVGYFTLQGSPPFSGGSAASLLSQHIATPVPLLEGPGIPRRLARALERCLAKDPAARPQKGEDFAESLGQVLEAHKELPVALRVFVKRGGRLGGMGGLVYLLFSFAFLGVAVSLATRGHEVMTFWLAFGAAFGVGPVVMLAFRARRFLASGFDPKDLPAAFQAELEQGLEERVFEYGRRASPYERVTGLLAAAGVGTAITAAFMGGLSGFGGSALVAFSWA
ncbi:MAG TPA: serine/threonine-protein kinase, partial [Gemmatimonadales bacterium]|nr:serine/threonine-protein kinase [Gemmatimonadales bacterium]